MYNDFLVMQYDQLLSTQIKAKELIHEGVGNHNVVVVTAFQTNGRAKGSRHWASAKGDLACTVLLKSDKDIIAQHQVTYVAAIAVSNTVSHFLPNHVINHKWVNDVLVNKRKISGILLEHYRSFIVLGIGVNILPKQDCDGLNAIGIGDLRAGVSCSKFLEWLLKELHLVYTEWNTFGFSAIKNQWLAKAINLNQGIKIVSAGQSKTGIFLGLDDYGNLQLAHNGEVALINVGDVFL